MDAKIPTIHEGCSLISKRITEKFKSTETQQTIISHISIRPVYHQITVRHRSYARETIRIRQF
ncbi:hypothetical protein HZS_114 [Henneguya salminicola]|nr:hypothetical protein HZS_114 [Henneguya salminicola]